MKKYDKYKDSGIEWIGEIPEHWDCYKIKFLYNFSMGATILKSDLKKDGKIPVYSATESDTIFGYVDKTNVILAEDDFVIPARGNSIGYIYLVKHKSTCTQTTIYAKDKKLDIGVSKFVFYYQKGLRKHLFQFDRTAIPQITVEQVKNNLLVIPPKPEQTAIANFLDQKTAEIDELIANKEKLLVLYEEEKTAIINQAVTKGINPNVKMKDSGVEWLGEIPEHWEVKKLKYVKKQAKNSFVDGPFGSNLKTKHFIQNGDVYVIESGFVTSGKFVYNRKFKTISFAHFKTISRSECNEKDIIIAKIGANFGMSAILPKLNKPSVVSGNSLKLTIDNIKYNLNFIHYQLLWLKFSGVIDNEVKGSAQPALSMGLMSELPFPIPTQEEQSAIVQHIETETSRIDQKITKTEKLIKLLKEYKTALISEVVTGKIDVREEK